MWLCALLIVVGLAICGWAVNEFQTNSGPTRGEILMVLPGVTFALLLLGLLLFAGLLVQRSALARWKLVTLATFACIGVIALPALFAIEWFEPLQEFFF